MSHELRHKLFTAHSSQLMACPFLLVTNHLSYVDIIAIASRIDCTLIAKRKWRHGPC